ncbi:diacylglycerol kinase catalytic domain-containing protein [Diaporthe amygdali]|uniref:diacylglycerol kinase catalytic domain-containing protein n=1 Tax=Phomopsis amygdali TaxID=1214568 RepID=UPI0022FEC31E|nr:diacylglycerol kinase catalytic domain-containing protein [Diaporthe amygdali]KAJ0118136.1 diacylglycerol kinase catalytic domain-containing protein [Diaporthe amygdali]
MAVIISDAAVEGLKPVRLPDDASLVKYDDNRITWSHQTQNDGEGKIYIKTEEIVLIAEVAAGDHLILALSQGEEGAAESFRLSAFVARNLRQDLLDQYLLSKLPDHLSAGAESSLKVVISTKSGTGQSQKFYDSVLQPLLTALGFRGEEAGVDVDSSTGGKVYQVTVTKDSNSVKDFSRERWGRDGGSTKRAEGSETVILLSGDGGIVDLLNGSTQPTEPGLLPNIAIIPLGTGNATFHSLHKPHYTASDRPAPLHLVLALQALLKGKSSPLPTFEALFTSGSQLVEEKKESTEAPSPISQLTGAIVASYGFHSQLVWESDTPAYRKHGDKRFGMVAQELLKEGHAYNASVETSSSTLSTTRYNYILATMVSNLEKTFTISPESKPLDGKLWLVHFGDVGGQKTMEIMMAAYNNGSHVGIEGVGYEAVDYVKVMTHEEDPRWRKVCIDGTIVELPQGGSMTVKKSPNPRLQVLVLGA